MAAKIRTNTLVMPVSGVKFCNQIAMVTHLLGCGYKPHRIMGSSGGGVTAMLLALSDVASVQDKETYSCFCDRLNAILDMVDSSWYMTPWVPNASILNSYVALCKGSMFDRGIGEKLIFDLDPDISTQPEIWLGTHCRDTGRAQVWCTKSEKEASIRPPGARYLDGDMHMTTKCTMASCAVPTIVPGVDINGEIHCDGGVSYASPLGQCMSEFENGNASYHVVYISPARYSSKMDPHTDELEDDDLHNLYKSSVAGMVRQLHIADRNNGLLFVGANYTKTFGIGRPALLEALRRSKTCDRSFIELAPVEEVHSDFLTLRKGDASKAVRKSYDAGFTVRQWYS